MTAVENRIEALLRAPLTHEQRALLDEPVRAAIAAGVVERRRRLPIRRSLILVVILMIVLPSIFVVGAAILSTEDPMGLAGAGEFQAELDVAKAAVVLPAGRTWPEFLRVTDWSAGYSRGGGRSWVESVAMCIWFDEWLEAREAGAVGREAIAARTIAGIPQWPSWNSPFWDKSVRDHYLPVIASVNRGDDAPARAEMTTNCSWLND
jgi:hypothetical protein